MIEFCVSLTPGYCLANSCKFAFPSLFQRSLPPSLVTSCLDGCPDDPFCPAPVWHDPGDRYLRRSFLVHFVFCMLSSASLFPGELVPSPWSAFWNQEHNLSCIEHTQAPNFLALVCYSKRILSSFAPLLLALATVTQTQCVFICTERVCPYVCASFFCIRIIITEQSCLTFLKRFSYHVRSSVLDNVRTVIVWS